MKYFMDTEFIEGFWNAVFYKPRHFIDLISIGIVCEDGREYYAISNEFNSHDADEWVKKNVIDKLEAEIFQRQSTYAKTYFNPSLKNLLKQFGKSNKQIANEVMNFCGGTSLNTLFYPTHESNIEFYGYYSDYDWVLLCSLFGRMIDLPKGFPMYCIDLKQTMDEKIKQWSPQGDLRNPELIQCFKFLPGFPKEENEHNALDDARWNKKLYEFLQSR